MGGPALLSAPPHRVLRCSQQQQHKNSWLEGGLGGGPCWGQQRHWRTTPAACRLQLIRARGCCCWPRMLATTAAYTVWPRLLPAALAPLCLLLSAIIHHDGAMHDDDRPQLRSWPHAAGMHLHTIACMADAGPRPFSKQRFSAPHAAKRKQPRRSGCCVSNSMQDSVSLKSMQPKTEDRQGPGRHPQQLARVPEMCRRFRCTFSS